MREVLIADDHPLFRDALARAGTPALADAHLYDADSVAALLTLIEPHPHAELLLLDLHMPGANGFSALVHVRGQQPGLPVIVVSAQEDARVIQRAIGHGASGYIPKSTSADDIVIAIRRVLEGDVWLPQHVSGASANVESAEAAAAAHVAELTPQQFRVLGMIAEGLLNKKIAYELKGAEAT